MDLPDKGLKQITTILKREAIERKDLIKAHWYQGEDVRLLSKIILAPLKDIKGKIAVFKNV